MESQNHKRALARTELEVLDQIAVWREESVQAELHFKRQNANISAKISKGMMDGCYNRDTQQCCVKAKELRQAYQKTKDANSRSGSEPHTCQLCDELHAILGVAPTTTPPLSVDTCKRGVSGNRDEEFEDETEVVDDSAQQASRESLLRGSQELFIFLEPIPSQGMLLDHEAGGGISAANVSTLPLSSPSQRPAQIRRQKNHTCDEMFSELMQSSHTERAQQTAWRQTTAESRKALNEQDERREEHAERRQDAMLRLIGEQTDMLKHLV
ncbi:uncharacterized protein ACDP82_005621 [Pangshura tecta]